MNSEIKKYDIIYADPPWRYHHSFTDVRKIENKYPTMALEDIKALKVPAKENAVLYLWATAPKLPEALEVVKAWGFTYRTCAVWDKEIIGMGYWFRGQHELLLVGRKGKFSPPAPDKRISSIIREKRTKHSKKPDLVRNMIMKWYPDASRIELFSRENHFFWDSWGNEVNNDIEIDIKKGRDHAKETNKEETV